MSDASSSELALVSVNGPEPCSAALRPPGPITIGRSSHHHLCLNDSRISRDHAILTWTGPGDGAPAESGRWSISDSGSRHGTWVNGSRLAPGRALAISTGDRIAIPPWTFVVGLPGEVPASPTILATMADPPHATVSKIDTQIVTVLAQERLSLLLRCAEAIHSARNESALAEAIVDAAMTGTGFANVALLRAGAVADEFALVAHRGRVTAPDSPVQLSFSLLQQAATGTPARLTRRAEEAPQAVSIVELGIQEALCVPILIEGHVAGFLYLDDRTGQGTRSGDEAAGFAVGLSRLAALAWANLRRIEAERRSATMEAELSAAGRMQSLLMPPREGTHGPFRWTGQSRPGRFVGGDFFDLIPLAEDRLAVAVGDVAGKGVEAGVLMTASQGFLHAALQEHGDPGRALTELNQYLFPRCPGGKFATLWIAVLDHRTHSMFAVDAGHGHVFLVASDGTLSPVPIPKNYPVAIMEDAVYQATQAMLPDSGKLLVLSDGLLEECSVASEGEPERERRMRQFSAEGVQRCLAKLPPGEDEVSSLFKAVEAHAGTDQLADDATAVLVRW